MGGGRIVGAAQPGCTGEVSMAVRWKPFPVGVEIPGAPPRPSIHFLSRKLFEQDSPTPSRQTRPGPPPRSHVSDQRLQLAPGIQQERARSAEPRGGPGTPAGPPRRPPDPRALPRSIECFRPFPAPAAPEPGPWTPRPCPHSPGRKPVSCRHQPHGSPSPESSSALSFPTLVSWVLETSHRG